jgi:energy-coupling factor transport system permease protein
MNTWSWIAWLSSSLIFISATRNPLYLVLLLLVLNIIFLFWNESVEGNSVAIVSPIKFSLFIIGMATIFNTLTSHNGETILFAIPGALPLISGPVTLEAMIFGFTNGLVLSAMLTAFTIVNVVLPISALIRLVPRAFYPLSIVVSIAITFLPSTRRQIDQVLEAQAIRGHRLSGLRDWLPLLMPLLIGGLERSMQLAETMTARGFASNAGTFTAQIRSFVFGGLLLVVAGWIAGLLKGYQYFGIFSLLCGVALIGIAIWQVGRQMPGTSYKKERWRRRDLLLVGVSFGVISLLLVGFPDAQKATLFYQPYPKAAFPAFDIEVGFMIQTLLLPILFKRDKQP